MTINRHSYYDFVKTILKQMRIVSIKPRWIKIKYGLLGASGVAMVLIEDCEDGKKTWHCYV